MPSNPTPYQAELDIAIQAALAAGAEIMQVYGEDDFAVEYKKDCSPLTEADKRANALICRMLGGAFPNYAILAEESKDDLARLENDFCFVVDPLDGTKEFIKRNGQFTVNIALAYRHRSVMGVIFVPATGELYYANSGAGAYCEKPGTGTDKTKLKASDRLTDIRMVTSASHGSVEEERLIEEHQIKHCLRIGSSLKGCLVASGAAEIYYRWGPTMEWDTAAMQCIAEEAGAIFRQMDGAQMLYNRENSRNDKGFYVVNRAENIFKGRTPEI
ncbi:MAG: 3'(2'),5'-bisphosphate nucleotidase CysQ [Lachnospiraceae bacterium]|jgi:3'(2'), 5'-bisphosphate nucleotidase|nr:3'(2'),5'-bisphosphate nucleotidase CysQ [Lachnospiraceae bacterium]